MRLVEAGEVFLPVLHPAKDSCACDRNTRRLRKERIMTQRVLRRGKSFIVPTGDEMSQRLRSVHREHMRIDRTKALGACDMDKLQVGLADPGPDIRTVDPDQR